MSEPDNVQPPSSSTSSSSSADGTTNKDAASNVETQGNEHGGERRDRNERHGGGNRRRFQNQPRRGESSGRSESSNRSESQNRGGDASSVQSINMNELRSVVELISSHGFTDFELEREGFRVRLRREVASSSQSNQTSAPAAVPTQPMAASFVPQPVAQAAPPQAATGSSNETASAATTTAPAADADLYMITSPIVGTFYRSPSPTSDSFVRVGSVIEPDTVVCIVEAMKLMNEIPAETSGTIEKIFVENGQPVEYGQALFGVRR